MIKDSLRFVAFATLLPICCTELALAQVAAGDWNGVLNIPPGLVRTVGIHIDETSPGAYSGSIFSPEAGAGRAVLAEMKLAGDTLSFQVPAIRSSFEGRWSAEKKAWVGEYTTMQGKYALTLDSGELLPLKPLPAVAGLDGRWEGKLQGVMPLVVRLKTDVDGTVAMMDSPSQRSMNVPIPSFAREGSSVFFGMPAIGAKYTGELSATGEKIAGTFTQLGQSMPLELTRVSFDASPTILKPRPQTPQRPHPYKEEELKIDNPAAPGITLACTLTLPQTSGRHPAAMLLSGSGAQDRDEQLLGHRPFLVLADHLTKKGIAVLRCDDRDFGKMSAAASPSLISDFVTDAKAGLAFLRARADIDAKRIGLIGHSEGGVTGPRVAADDPKVAFVVMMAGLGATGRDVLLEQRAMLMQSTGAKPENVEIMRALFGKMFDAMMAAPDEAGAKAAAAKVLAAMPTQDGNPLPQATIDSLAGQFGGRYYVDLLRYDPRPVLSKIKAPILAINGSKDVQVAAKQNLDGIKKLAARNKDVTAIELPGLNHLFQTATTGAVSEYADIDETLAPIALDAISDWLVKRMKP